ncbi:MAG: DNA/RNA nuclease SfsA [Myxococcales bacterium]|nr:DNA/RNA nuclease SfsA [Myxococcales bacterium]MCH7868719.1 DNA/RNA nuclease SfsA [Myxococcales bacterium]
MVGCQLDQEPRRSQAVRRKPVNIPVRADLKGVLLRRYKRFLADIETSEGEQITVHCPNPGAMTGCATPGSQIRCSTSDNPKRKLRHTLEMIRVGRSWVGLQPMHANRLVKCALEAGAIAKLRGYREVRPEVVVHGGSRLDFLLNDHPSRREPLYIEVKSVTLADRGVARFPDAITTRGRRHMDTLAQLHRQGARAVVLFIVQRVDCSSMEPADAIDPEYAKALRRACASGVEAIAMQARVTSRTIQLEHELPVRL